jgi:hypothetical protein
LEKKAAYALDINKAKAPAKIKREVCFIIIIIRELFR